MHYSYFDYVKRYSDNFIRVVLDDETIKNVEKLAEQVIVYKAKEKHHQIDGKHELKRFMTGILGEAALEKLLHISIRDWHIIDDSSLHNIPDIPGYNVGIKTVEFGKFPIIFKQNRYPQIICIRGQKNPNVFFVCGLATSDVLNTYQDDDLILDKNLRARGTKTGFYGFQNLKKVVSLDDLKEYKK